MKPRTITVDLAKSKLATGCTCGAVAAMQRRATGRTLVERRHLEAIAATIDRSARAYSDDVLPLVAGVLLGWSPGETPFHGWLRATIRDTVIAWALSAPKAQLAEMAARAAQQTEWVEYHDSRRAA